MRREDGDLGYVWDMRQYALEVQEVVREIDEETFLDDWRSRRIIERCIEVIGEAASHVSGDFRAQHGDIAWRPIIAQRHVLAHEYGDIRYDAIWRVATIRIPTLLLQLDAILDAKPQ
jgi:uncharacterized protein with HEPN domain